MKPAFRNCFDPKAAVHDILNELEWLFSTRIFENAPPRPSTVALAAPAAEAVKFTASGLPLASGPLQEPPIHIPNAGDGANSRHSYRTDLVLLRDPSGSTLKVLWWHDMDPRPDPHNHPWDFRSAIFSGGYTEERTEVRDGKPYVETVSYEAGDVNVMPANLYHSVVSVQPGTVTLLDCGPAKPGNEWGYLDLKELKYKNFKELAPANFVENFRALNPHLLKRG